jgi:hypothetical protein
MIGQYKKGLYPAAGQQEEGRGNNQEEIDDYRDCMDRRERNSKRGN